MASASRFFPFQTLVLTCHILEAPRTIRAALIDNGFSAERFERKTLRGVHDNGYDFLQSSGKAKVVLYHLQL